MKLCRCHTRFSRCGGQTCIIVREFKKPVAMRKLALALIVVMVCVAWTRCDVMDCVRWCNSEFKRCVDAVAQSMPDDKELYDPCDKEWERCEENCHSSD